MVTDLSSNKRYYTDYLTGFQYGYDEWLFGGTSSVVLSFFPHKEGYVNNRAVYTNPWDSTPSSYVYEYVYNHTDHLGNVRLSYRKNGTSTQIIEENNYYPFGMKHKGYNDNSYGTAYKYKYNGKEFQDELNLNVYDFSARVFDPASVIAWQHDPLSEQTHTPYSLFYGNPIKYNDPTGMGPNDWVKKDNQWIWDANITSRQEATNQGYDDYAQPGYTYQAWKNFDEKSTVLLGDNGNWSWVPNFIDVPQYQEDPYLHNPLARPTISEVNLERQMLNNQFHSYQIGQGIRIGAEMIGTEVAVAKIFGSSLNYLAYGSRLNRNFWSGGNIAKNEAMNHAISTGGTTLERTWVGNSLEYLTEKTSYSYMKPFWDYSSYSYANGARGSVNVFINQNAYRTSSIWNTVERPLLQTKGININANLIK